VNQEVAVVAPQMGCSLVDKNCFEKRQIGNTFIWQHFYYERIFKPTGHTPLTASPTGSPLHHRRLSHPASSFLILVYPDLGQMQMGM